MSLPFYFVNTGLLADTTYQPGQIGNWFNAKLINIDNKRVI